ncbi:hypothetical protein SAMN05519103_08121 [Rhizobiales bacterium GAS113]|nr:hypothetical protein SAMN05519103_08121 [Rhizobiales bacterium GAS113]SED04651.1 hypothetical protein SAMN05519104_2669 [Rhizobiales bacterium GAS188]
MKRVAANGQKHRAVLTKHAKLGVVMTSIALLAAGCADMPIFHGPAEATGFATKPAEGADFVKTSRPEEMDYTSVGIEPGHPPDKPRDAVGVKKLQAELEAQRDAGHAILQKLSPGAAAAQDAKAKSKVVATKRKTQSGAAEKQKDEGQAPASQ